MAYDTDGQGGRATDGPHANLPAEPCARRVLAQVVRQPVHAPDEESPNGLERGFHRAQQRKGKLGQLRIHHAAQACLQGVPDLG